MGVTTRPAPRRHPGGRRAQDHRQRHRRHRDDLRLPDRGADLHRRHRPAAHHRREPRPGPGGRGHGPPRRPHRGVGRASPAAPPSRSSPRSPSTSTTWPGASPPATSTAAGPPSWWWPRAPCPRPGTLELREPRLDAYGHQRLGGIGQRRGRRDPGAHRHRDPDHHPRPRPAGRHAGRVRPGARHPLRRRRGRRRRRRGASARWWRSSTATSCGSRWPRRSATSRWSSPSCCARPGCSRPSCRGARDRRPQRGVERLVVVVGGDRRPGCRCRWGRRPACRRRGTGPAGRSSKAEGGEHDLGEGLLLGRAADVVDLVGEVDGGHAVGRRRRRAARCRAGSRWCRSGRASRAGRRARRSSAARASGSPSTGVRLAPRGGRRRGSRPDAWVAVAGRRWWASVSSAAMVVWAIGPGRAVEGHAAAGRRADGDERQGRGDGERRARRGSRHVLVGRLATSSHATGSSTTKRAPARRRAGPRPTPGPCAGRRARPPGTGRGRRPRCRRGGWSRRRGRSGRRSAPARPRARRGRRPRRRYWTPVGQLAHLDPGGAAAVLAGVVEQVGDDADQAALVGPDDHAGQLGVELDGHVGALRPGHRLGDQLAGPDLAAGRGGRRRRRSGRSPAGPRPAA